MSEKKSKMGLSPVNFSILQSTESNTAADAQEVQTQADKAPEAQKVSRPAPAAKVPPPLKGYKKKADPPLAKQKPTAPKPKEKPQDDPFGYDVGPKWPLVGYEKPFLIQTPENQGRAAAALSIRIPLDLNLTVERHCAKLGIMNLSEWVREAMSMQLALEQQELAKK